MCRLYGFRATAPTRLDCSLLRAQNALVTQSRLDRRGLANADGWGVGFYEAGRAVVHKSDTAAYEDQRFTELAAAIESRTVLAHVRQATVGRGGLANTHPFAHGVWSFAHNGTLTAFARVAPGLEQEVGADLLSERRGSTDSELIFLWLLSRMSRAGIELQSPCADSTALKTLLAESILLLAARSDEAGAREPAKLNVILTDGATLVSSRWGNTLYSLSRQGVRDCEICDLQHVGEDLAAGDGADGYRAAVVASEPITQEGWEEVPDRSIVAVNQDVALTTCPIA